jgi:hypothetical protein
MMQCCHAPKTAVAVGTALLAALGRLASDANVGGPSQSMFFVPEPS